MRAFDHPSVARAGGLQSSGDADPDRPRSRGGPASLARAADLAVAGVTLGIPRLALIGFLLATVVVGVLAAVSARELANLLRDQADLTRHYRIMAGIDEMEFILSETVNGYSAFVVSADPDGLAAFRSTSNRIAEQAGVVAGELQAYDPQLWERFRRTLDASLAAMSSDIALAQVHAGDRARGGRDAMGLSQELMAMVEELDLEQHKRLQVVEKRTEWRLPRLVAAIALLATGLGAALTILYRLIRSAADHARKTLASLTESEERFRALTELSADWYWQQDEHLRFVDLSAGFAPAVGLSPEQVLGYTRWEVNADLIGPEQRERLDGMLARRERFRDFVMQRRAADGSVRIIAISGMPIFDREGVFRGYRGLGCDITEQERLRAALERSEERLRLATEFGHIGIWERDFSSDVIHWSPNVAGMFGFADRRTSSTPELFQQSLHPDDREREALARRAWYVGQQDYNIEHRVVHPDGSIRWLYQRGNMYRDAAGRPVRTLGVVQDITERKLAQERLSDSEQRFRALTDLSVDWYWEQDEELRFTFFSEGAFQTLGKWAAELIGKRRWECPTLEVSGERWEMHRADLAERLPFRHLQTRHVDQRGNVRWFDVSGTPVFDREGRFKGYRGIGRDITLRMTVAKALEESEHRFRTLTAVSSDWYWEQDSQYRFTLVSDNAYRILGRFPGSLIGLQRWEVPNLAPATCGWEEHKRVLLDHRPFRDFVLHDSSGERGRRIIAISGVPIVGDDDNFQGYRGTAQDITERTVAEQVLRESEERFRLLAENMRDVFWIYSFKRKCFTYVGASYEQVWGQPREVVYADAGAYRKLIAPEHVAAVDEARGKQRRGEQTEVEFQIHRPDGQVRWLVARSGSMTDSRGEPLVCGITEDITERKLREQRRLDESLRQRDALVREVHHRIKNNLQGVVGLLRSHARRARETSHVLEAAIQQVQSVAMVHGLQGMHNRGGVALFEIVDAIARMQSGLTERVIRVEHIDPLASAILVAEGEAVGVALALNELINNAAKHSDANRPGILLVEVERKLARVQVRVRNRGGLPDGFDYMGGKHLGIGLGLVKALAPAEGSEIVFVQNGEFVAVTLSLWSPVVARWSSETNAMPENKAGDGMKARAEEGMKARAEGRVARAE